jgi:hypothetical protein
MLPYLQPKKMASVIIARRHADGSHKSSHEEGQHAPELMSCAETLIKAVHAKDAHAVAQALEDAFKHLEQAPHVEGEHLEGSAE